MASRLKATLVLISLSVTFGFSQTTEHIKLSDLLDSLELQYDVKFSYIDEHIEGVQLKNFPTSQKLNSILNELEAKTGLNFEKLNNRIITISKRPQATQLCGFVFDKATGEPLEGATILYIDKFILSDGNGRFAISSTNLPDEVVIRYFGYESKQVSLPQTVDEDCLEIKLNPITTVLDAVTIENYLVKGVDKKSDGSISIHINETEILPGLIEPDILHTVQQLPGIQSVDETVSNINVRGGTNDQNLILWNGIKMYQTGHFFGLISAFNPYLTEQVTLIKNGSPARYKEGVSSIIDIKTYDEVSKEAEIGAGLNMINGDIYVKMPLTDKIAIHASARRSIADFVSTPTFENYFDRAFRGTEVGRFLTSTDVLSADENFLFYDYSGKLLYDISPKDKVRLSFLNIYNQIEYQETGIFANSEQTKNSELEQYNLAGSAKYIRRWQENIKTNLSLDISSYNLSATNFDIPNDQRFFQENEVLDINFSSELEWKLANNLAIDIGYQFNEIGVTNKDEVSNPDFKRNTKEVLRTHVNFLESSFASANGDLVGALGLRTSYFNKFNMWRFEPRLSLNYALTESLSLELLAETKSQVTTQIIDFQTDFLGVEKRRWVLVDEEEVPLITSAQTSLGLHYQKKNILLSLEGFVKEVEGIITSSQGFHNQFEFVRSSGSYTSGGFDFLINNRLGDFNLWTSYSYSTNTYSFPNLDPAQFPNNLDIRHVVSLGTNYHINNIAISAGIDFHTGRPYTSPQDSLAVDGGAINYNSPNSSRVNNYIRPDFSISYQFPVGRAKVKTGISLWNFVDRQNSINRFYILSEDMTAQQVNVEALEFTPNFMVRVVF